MGTSTKEIIEVDGCEIAITNPHKTLFLEAGITKLDYLQKLVQLSPFLLEYCRNRHLTTIRFPSGVHGPSFYQKNCPVPAPAFVRTAPLNNIRYVVLDSLPTLLWLGNLACLEFHPSLHHVNDPLPAEWIIDIDPPRDQDPRLMEAAALIGDLLHSLHIESVPKTSGATGVQIYVPIVRGYTFGQLRKVGQFIAEYLTQTHPRLFTVERHIKDRGGRIYIDYLQHWHGKTIAAPYTPRANPHAGVSTPLTWDEVRSGVRPEQFNLLTIEERLREKGDLIRQTPPQSVDAILRHLGELR